MEINNKDKKGLHELPNDALMFMSSNKEIGTHGRKFCHTFSVSFPPANGFSKVWVKLEQFE